MIRHIVQGLQQPEVVAELSQKFHTQEPGKGVHRQRDHCSDIGDGHQDQSDAAGHQPADKKQDPSHQHDPEIEQAEQDKGSGIFTEQRDEPFPGFSGGYPVPVHDGDHETGQEEIDENQGDDQDETHGPGEDHQGQGGRQGRFEGQDGEERKYADGEQGAHQQ